MSDFDPSYVGQLWRLVGKRLLLVPGTRIIIQDAMGCILLQERSDFGVWGLPGGNAEEGENLESVVVREV
jgi:ADP-ribose pyrophosphatase YjhB (NUDIX family)